MALPHEKQAVYSAIFRYLSDHSMAWDVMELTDLAEDSALLDFLYGYAPDNFDLYQSATNKVCPYLELPTDWSRFLQTKSANSRSKILYRRKYLEKRFTVHFVEVSTEKQLNDVFEDMVRLHQGRRTFKGDPGVFSSSSFRNFILAVCKSMLHKGRLQLVFMELNGIKVSFYLNMKYGNKVFFYQSGFDMAWSNLSVGYVLLTHLIEKAIDDQCKTYEFLRGEEKYKHEWAKSSIKLTDIIVSNSGFRGKAMKQMKFGYDITKKYVKRIIHCLLTPQ
jgi:CelD/BcsL family acetyltransferase involved in cellulose biosynthesis